MTTTTLFENRPSDDNEKSIQQRIIKTLIKEAIFEEDNEIIFRLEQITFAQFKNELGVDSLELLGLMGALENEFGIELADEEILSLDEFTDLEKLIKEKLTKK